MLRVKGAPTRHRTGSPDRAGTARARRLHARTVAAAGAVAALASVGLAPAAQSLGSTEPAAAAVVAARAVAPDNPRPAKCPPVPSSQGGPDTEALSTTGTFPWPAARQGQDPESWSEYNRTPDVNPPERPANWDQGGSNWMLTSARDTDPVVSLNPQQLCGVEGDSVDKAWQVTTGLPSTVIAITDSGIEWCDPAIVDKIYLNPQALPLPEDPQGLTKPQLEARGMRFDDTDPRDLIGSGVFNVAQYSGDPRIAKPYFCADAAKRDGFSYSGISPADLIATFGTPGSRYYYGHQGPAGYTEAIAGWNFVDDNNNPYDDVHYDHGSGEAEDSTGAADTVSQEVGTCPNCMVLPVRVGESFIAEGNAFAQGVLFAVDSGASVVQEALGTLDETTTDDQAVQYALAHGVPVVASAADEEAEHQNEPANLPGTIVVNSTTETPTEGGVPISSPPGYLELNGCTNYGANISVTVESASCSSEATGKTGGIVGLVESEAAQLMSEGKLAPYPGLRSATGEPVALSAGEVAQLVTMSADDIDFQTAAPPFGPPDNYLEVSPIPTTRYPTQPGFDMYTGYGRIDAANMVDWLAAGQIPPVASLGNMLWFQTYDPTSSTIEVDATASAERTPGDAFEWELQYGVGTQPEPDAWYDITGGSGRGSKAIHVALGPSLLGRIASRLPQGGESRGVGPNGDPEPDAPAFTLRLVVTDVHGLVGLDRRTEYLDHDPSLVTGTALTLGGSIDASPTLAPVGPGGQDALIVATADGVVNAYRPVEKGSGQIGLAELPGWPVTTEPIYTDHLGEAAYTSGQVTALPRDSIVGGVAVGDLLGNGRLDVVAAGISGHVYARTAAGKMHPGFPVRTNPAYSEPAARNADNRLLPGILPAPALAHLQDSRQLDIVASSMDRHVYAWQPNGKPVPGWPVLVVDPAEVSSVDPVTNEVAFRPGSEVEIGSQIIDTPAIGSLAGSGRPDVVVGTDEEYGGSLNVSAEDVLNYAIGDVPLLNPANSRVYAISAGGALTAAPAGSTCRSSPQPDACAILPGWPVAIADYESGLLPDVADGVTASPALADLGGNGELDVGVMSSVGPGYVLEPNGRSYIGTGADGKPLTLSTGPAGPLSDSPETPTLPALGMPIMAPLGLGSAGISFIAPAASVGKAIDAALPDEQRPNDNQIDAWNPSTAQLLPAFPQVVNDLQFIVQPIAADVGGAAEGAYVVEGTATSDIRAIDALGREAPGFPKFTGGWMVNSPSFGPFGSLAYQVLAAGTRQGNLYVWSTPTPACAPSGPWPREHHDLSNTNNLDATTAAEPRCSAG